MTTLRDEILRQHSPAVRRRAELEYDVIEATIAAVLAAGFELDSVASDEIEPVTNTEDALRIIFDLDECTLRFRRAGADRLMGLYLVMGNDGWDVIADYTWDGGEDIDSPAPGTFAAAVEAAQRPFVEKYS